MSLLTEEIIELRKQGATYSEIEIETGASHPYIFRTLRNAGLTKSRTQVLKDKKEVRTRKIQARLRRQAEQAEIEERVAEATRSSLDRLRKRRSAS